MPVRQTPRQRPGKNKPLAPEHPEVEACQAGGPDHLLEQASQRFEQLFHGVPVACFCYDTRGCIVEWNLGSESLFRIPSGQALLMPVWDVIGRPEDAEIMQAFVQSVVSGHAYEGVEWEDETAAGHPRFLLSNAFPLRDRSGLIFGGITVNVDISERVRVERALWESEQRWQLALRGNNDGIWDWNAREAKIFVSFRWREILGYSDSDVLPWSTLSGSETEVFLETWFQQAHPDDRSEALAAFRRHLDRQTSFYSSEHRVRCHDDCYKWVLDRGQALWSRSGDVVRVVGSVTDITERKQYEQDVQEARAKLEQANHKLEALATEDGLTGLKNRRAFNERLEMEVERACRYGLPLSVVLLDVDNFKQYNDTYGHLAGDDVLRTVARLLSDSVREADLAARYGGEEFVMILPHTEAADAFIVAERCRAAIEMADWPERRVTASFGLAAHCRTMTASDLLAAADEALYRSKRQGRNRVTVAGSE